jgi:hypothetical protein
MRTQWMTDAMLPIKPIVMTVPINHMNPVESAIRRMPGSQKHREQITTDRKEEKGINRDSEQE